MTSPEGGKSNGPRQFFVMRHGERCDFAFGRSWLNSCFDDKGRYTQKDLNMPVTMVKRDSHKEFLKDSPLTRIGQFQARSTGEALRAAKANIRYIYVSPSLRCVQTAQGIIDGLQDDSLSMRIEPAAFEWLGWYKDALPAWISPKQLAAMGFNVNDDHEPIAVVKDLNMQENVTEYYGRCHWLAQKILENHVDDEGDILVVAHAGSLDTFTRQLQGRPPRGSKEMHNILASFSYCCLCCCQEEKPKVWKLQAPPIPPLHGFDWKVML